MTNKKISRILGPVLGVMGFILTLGLLEVPALAEDNVQVNSGYTDSSISMEYNINKSATQNGLKVIIDKAVATKHKLKVVVKVESEKPFDKSKLDNLITQVTFGENHWNGESRSEDYPDDKTLLINIEQENDEQEFPEKGELRVDVVLPSYKVNIGIDAPVDFTESFKKTIEKNISVKIPEYDFTLNKLETSILGTRLTYSEHVKNYSDRDNAFSRSHNSSMILKVGDRMYKTNSSGSSSSGSKKDDVIITGNYESEVATYDRLKDQKDISIIPIVCNITSEEMDKIFESNYKNQDNEGKNRNEETTNNVKYIKYFQFSNGNKGEIYNIERTDNIVKVYCRGNSEKESLVMASNINMYYHFEEGKDNYINYDGNRHMSFYKNSNDFLGYVVEFNNVEKDKWVDLNFDYLIKQIDRYKVGDEIQISK